jgi:major type 1 subunit fimbrin (pilin)
MRNVIRMYGKALSLGLVALTALKSGAAWADCYLAGPIVNLYVDGPAGGTVVDATLAPGAQIGAGAPPSLQKTFSLVCQGGAGNSNPVYFRTTLVASAVANGYLYEFTVGGKPAGVGMYLSMGQDGGDYQDMPVLRQKTLPNSTDVPNNAPSYTETDQFKAIMVRTSNPVIYGTVDRGAAIGASNFYNGTGEVGQVNQYQRYYTGDITLVQPSCTIDASSLNQTVDLGNYSTKDLQNPSDATPWKSFQLVVAHCENPVTLTDITFGSTTDQDTNNQNLFSLNTGGVTGMGIALATDEGTGTPDAPVLPGVVATFPAVTTTGGTYNFKARIERTTAPLTPGEFRRPVTVVVNYR